MGSAAQLVTHTSFSLVAEVLAEFYSILFKSFVADESQHLYCIKTPDLALKPVRAFKCNPGAVRLYYLLHP